MSATFYDASTDQITAIQALDAEGAGDPDYPREIRAGALADSRLYCTQKNP